MSAPKKPTSPPAHVSQPTGPAGGKELQGNIAAVPLKGGGRVELHLPQGMGGSVASAFYEEGSPPLLVWRRPDGSVRKTDLSRFFEPQDPK